MMTPAVSVSFFTRPHAFQRSGCSSGKYYFVLFADAVPKGMTCSSFTIWGAA